LCASGQRGERQRRLETALRSAALHECPSLCVSVWVWVWVCCANCLDGARAPGVLAQCVATSASAETCVARGYPAGGRQRDAVWCGGRVVEAEGGLCLTRRVVFVCQRPARAAQKGGIVPTLRTSTVMHLGPHSTHIRKLRETETTEFSLEKSPLPHPPSSTRSYRPKLASMLSWGQPHDAVVPPKVHRWVRHTELNHANSPPESIVRVVFDQGNDESSHNRNRRGSQSFDDKDKVLSQGPSSLCAPPPKLDMWCSRTAVYPIGMGDIALLTAATP
jgi:hypothetical protein